MLRRKLLAVVTTLALALGMSVGGAATAFANPNNGSEMNQTSYWKNQYPHAVECYKHDGSGGEHGREIDGGVRLNTFQQSWPGNRWEVLIVKGGSGDNFGNAVYPLPEANKVYYAPNNKNTTTPADVSHWIVCKGSTPAAASVSVTPETCTSPAKLVLGATTQARFDTATYTNVTGGQNYTVVARAIDSATFPIGTPNMNQARTQVTFTGFLPNANPANCPTATGDITFAGVSCEKGASPLVDPGSFVNVKDATGRVVKDGTQGGAFEVVFTAKQGTTFAAGLAGVRDGKTFVLSQDRKTLTITGTLPGANIADCAVATVTVAVGNPSCEAGAPLLTPADVTGERIQANPSVVNNNDGTFVVTVTAASGARFPATIASTGGQTFEVSADRRTVVVTGSLPGANIADCAVASVQVKQVAPTCELAAPVITTADVTGTNTQGTPTLTYGDNGAFVITVTAATGARFPATIDSAEGLTFDVSSDRRSVVITGTRAPANPAACVETSFEILTNDPTCTTGTTIADIVVDEDKVTVTQVPSQDGRSITVTFTARDGYVFAGGTKEETRVVRILGPDFSDCELAEAALSVPPPTCDAGQNWDDVSFVGTLNAQAAVTQEPTAENNWTYIVTFTATDDAKFFENGEYSTTKQLSDVIVPDPDRGECTIITAEVGTTDPACNQPAVLDPAQFVSNPAGAATFDIGFTNILGTYSVTVTAKEGFAFEGGKKSITLTGELAGPDQSQCDQPTIEGSIASTACETDVPYVLFSIELTDPDGVATAEVTDASIIFEVLGDDGQPELDSAGNPKRIVLDNLQGTVDDNGVFSGRVLWPGAAVVDGQAAGWPGWALVDGEWTNVGDANYGWTRTLNKATLSVNPSLVVDLSYPPASPECATEPTAVDTWIEAEYDCLKGGTITLSDTPGVIWTVDGEQTDLRVLTGYSLDDTPSIEASIDPEQPGLYLSAESITEEVVEFQLPETGCDLVTAPLVTPTLSSTQASCTTAGSYTLNAIEGVQWFVNGQPAAAGAYAAITGSTVNVEAVALQGFGFGFETQTEWTLRFPAPAAGSCDLPTLSLEETDLPTLALTGASGMLGTVGIIALLITLTGIGAVVARRRVEA